MESKKQSRYAQAMRWRPSPAMVVAMVALFVSLAGVGWAATTLKKNSVKSKQIKNGAVASVDIKDNDVSGTDVDESSLGAVPSAANADLLDGVDSSDYARRGVIDVTAHSGLWRAGGAASTLQFSYFSNLTRITRPTAGLDFADLPFVIPDSANGEQLAAETLRYCYTASADVVLEGAVAQVLRNTNSASASTVASGADLTHRTDSACRQLSLSGFGLQPGDTVALVFQIRWLTDGAQFDVGNGLLRLSQTNTGAPPVP